MGKRGGGSKQAASAQSKFQKTVSLREEASGKKQTKGGSTNVKAILKHEHLQNLAVWASGEASIPSLSSFFGHRLAADGEASAIPPDPSFFPCQRCETILQPGFNCTVRIEKNRAKVRNKHKKLHIMTQNSVVYNCHFCLHRNMKRGTPKGHMKEMHPPKLKAPVPKAVKSRPEKVVACSGKETNKDELKKVDVISSPVKAAENPTADDPVTPMSRGRTLLDLNKRKRNKSGSKRPAESENNPKAEKTVDASSKRRRKSWMSLREIVESGRLELLGDIVPLHFKPLENPVKFVGFVPDGEPEEDAKPIGAVVRLSGKGKGRRSHYEAFEFDGNRYDLEDPVLLVPEDKEQKPYVAIIKDISQTKAGTVMVNGQWFYRPEEAEKKGGGSWQSRDTRELFYSFHHDECPAESVMHRCVVHFVPLHKQLPNRKQHPGFIVQKVYDTEEKKLWNLTDKDYEENKQHEIDILVQKTLSRLGDLPDIEINDTAAVGGDREDQLKAKRTLRKKNISPLDVTRDDEGSTRSDQNLKAETPGSCTSNTTEHYTILSKFNVLTGENLRDRWMEKLLQGVQYMCNSPDSMHIDDKGKGSSDSIDRERDAKSSVTTNGSHEKASKSGKSFQWPDAAVSAVSALEKVSHDALSSDFQKYNQKLRQLVFNLKNNQLLARRLLNGELEPITILNMSPNELKMTDARCSRCSELKVGVRDIIQAGHGDRYQLECIACGNSWYASRDEASSLTIGPSNSVKGAGNGSVAKPEPEKKLVSPRPEPEKKLVSPRESESIKEE
ncbi:hypothetical protein CCACVL1_13611 [Corchorus capsularis]|uniref:BAH domain-containing protein n=1 Tax=Corchorus capsularis TaxID=210143 RepID=A0A1R3IA88_COCAP|nr:hypothetical protein CCACVL1_13611 [Corchorus capsularis]